MKGIWDSSMTNANNCILKLTTTEAIKKSNKGIWMKWKTHWHSKWSRIKKKTGTFKCILTQSEHLLPEMIRIRRQAVLCIWIENKRVEFQSETNCVSSKRKRKKKCWKQIDQINVFDHIYSYSFGRKRFLFVFVFVLLSVFLHQ